MSVVKDAATVLLLRGEDPFEVFMVRRGKTAKFMANAMVFPGGRLDDADLDDALLPRCDIGRREAATLLGMEDGATALGLLVAAARETFEEAGVLLGAAARPDALEDARAALNEGRATLAEAAARGGLTLRVGALRYVARWVTPPVEPRRYDTRFFALRAPATADGAAHDDIETTASAWLSPQAALAAYDAGEITLAPPTYRILLELARSTVDDLLAPRPIPAPIQPHVAEDEGALVLCLPGDVLFDPPGEGRNRFTLRDGRWHSEGRGF